MDVRGSDERPVTSPDLQLWLLPCYSLPAREAPWRKSGSLHPEIWNSAHGWGSQSLGRRGEDSLPPTSDSEHHMGLSATGVGGKGSPSSPNPMLWEPCRTLSACRILRVLSRGKGITLLHPPRQWESHLWGALRAWGGGKIIIPNPTPGSECLAWVGCSVSAIGWRVPRKKHWW